MYSNVAAGRQSDSPTCADRDGVEGGRSYFHNVSVEYRYLHTRSGNYRPIGSRNPPVVASLGIEKGGFTNPS
jgi:hypothetical protein